MSDVSLLMRLALSAILIVAVLSARAITGRLIRGKAELLNQDQRRQLFYARSAFSIALVIGLLIIWLGTLQNLLLSLTAVTLAIVIATKELLLCISGAVLRTSGGLFALGDWIEVEGIRGEVTDLKLLCTTILELEPAESGHAYTGRTLMLPNSMLHAHPVRREGAARSYVAQRCTITVEPGLHTQAALRWLENEARRLYAPFERELSEQSNRLDRELGIDVPGPQPAVGVRTTELGKICFEVTLYCPQAQASALERELISGFLDAVSRGDIAQSAVATPVPTPATQTHGTHG